MVMKAIGWSSVLMRRESYHEYQAQEEVLDLANLGDGCLPRCDDVISTTVVTLRLQVGVVVVVVLAVVAAVLARSLEQAVLQMESMFR